MVNDLFPRFDDNNSGGLDVKELANFFNTAFKALGYNITVTQDEAVKALIILDKNADRAASREELFIGLKEILLPGGVQAQQDWKPESFPQQQKVGQNPPGGQPGQQGQNQLN